jgi:hypothetical protein
MNKDIQSDVTPVKQMISNSQDARVYRCEKCQKESPRLNNGTELRLWFLSHVCEE